MTPFQALLVEASEENANTIAMEPTSSYVNKPIGANLISQDFNMVNNKFKDYQISETGVITVPDPEKTPTLTNDSGWLRTSLNPNQAISASNPFSFSTRDFGKSAQNYTYIATTITTEPGKLYQFKYDTKLYNLGGFASSPQNSVIGMSARVATHGSNVTYKSNSYSLAGTSAETVTNKDEIIEFRATSDKTVISAEMSYMNLDAVGGYHFAAMSNYSIKEIDEATNQEARETIASLFVDNDVTGTINSTTDQVAIDTAQNLVTAIISDSVKAELQHQLNEAQNQLDARLAEAAVNALTDDQNIILSTTDQTSIDKAQALIDNMPDSPQKTALQEQLKDVQAQLDSNNATLQAEKDRQDAASDAVKDLFTNNNTSSDTIKDTTDQATIDAAKALVDVVTEPTVKADLEQNIAKAQSALDAKNEATQAETNRQNVATDAVKDLFTNNDTSSDTIKDTTDQAAIDAAQALVDAVTDPMVKADLEQNIAKAQSALEAKNEATQAETDRQNAATDAVKDLFTSNDTSSDTIKDTTNQATIDAAQALVDAVTDPMVKADLEQDIAKAQSALEAKNEATQAETDRQNAATDAVKDLFTNNDISSDTIKGTTDQATIDAAQALVDVVTDPTVKADLEQNIAKAQSALEAKNEATQAETNRQNAATDAVKDLFTNNDTSSDTTKDTTDQVAIEATQKLIDAVTDPVGKSNLQKDLDRAQSLLNERLATIGTITPADFLIGGDKYVTGTFTGSVAKISLSINDKEYTGGTVKADGTFTFYTNDKNIKNTDKVLAIAYDKYGKKLAEQQITFVELTKGKITPATYNLSTDKNITGTYTNDVTKVTVTVGDKEYKGGTVANGAFIFYAFDKIKNVTDVVTVKAYDTTGKLLDTKTLNVITGAAVVTKGSIAVNDMLVPGDKNITGTYTDDVHYVVVTVDGTEYKGGTFTDDAFKFYAFDKISNAESNVTMQAFDKAGKLLDTKTVKLAGPAKVSIGKVQPDIFTLGTDKNITGTYTDDVHYAIVTVDGTEYKGGTFVDGAFKFYAFDKISSVGSNVTMQAFDKAGKLLDTKVIEVVSQ